MGYHFEMPRTVEIEYILPDNGLLIVLIPALLIGKEGIDCLKCPLSANRLQDRFPNCDGDPSRVVEGVKFRAQGNLSDAIPFKRALCDIKDTHISKR
ncbi:hypothetical protein A3C25_06470 [Candidatus Roizmanbacteria bacterium RIFCSPHIGHO2_02_FULL_38_11]|uniref:Uncharacterized protein n=1 Tax=Candidatus Roizmanbacteria bacterium RIFCSPHIGHO2_02_FULL_38_11 TaxID=1802039 RepID=A0A1F7GX50_9BACT|nr:MAG: hypothetical protein A3C25_06470 [Candidatus Roizmanbacteria bacterium RIFCSPHIGHO2_02_FULL_38_11]